MQTLIIGRLQELLHELVTQCVGAVGLQLRIGQEGRAVEVGDGVVVKVQGLQMLAVLPHFLAAAQRPVVQLQGGRAGRWAGCY